MALPPHHHHYLCQAAQVTGPSKPRQYCILPVNYFCIRVKPHRRPVMAPLPLRPGQWHRPHAPSSSMVDGVALLDDRCVCRRVHVLRTAEATRAGAVGVCSTTCARVLLRRPSCSRTSAERLPRASRFVRSVDCPADGISIALKVCMLQLCPLWQDDDVVAGGP